MSQKIAYVDEYRLLTPEPSKSIDNFGEIFDKLKTY